MAESELKRVLFQTDIFPWLHLPRRKGGRWSRALIHQLASCVELEVSLTESLDCCLRQRLPRPRKKMLEKIRSSVEEGMYLSEALRKHAPKAFPPSIFGIIEIGEKSGQLKEAFKLINERYEDFSAIKRKAIALFLYPAVILLFCALMLVFLLIKVMPTFQEIYSDLHGSFPPLSAFIVSLSDFINDNLGVILILLFLGFIGIRMFARRMKRSPRLNGYLLSVPFFGPALHHLNMFYFSHMLSMLLQSGTALDESLLFCGDEAVWPIFGNAIKDMRQDVSRGEALSEALKKQEVFSATFGWFIANGELRGNLGDSLKAAAEFESAAFQHCLERLRLVEPVIIIMMSMAVGSVILAMALPIMQMPNLMQ